MKCHQIEHLETHDTELYSKKDDDQCDEDEYNENAQDEYDNTKSINPMMEKCSETISKGEQEPIEFWKSENVYKML